jgi:hypothetical protein
VRRWLVLALAASLAVASGAEAAAAQTTRPAPPKCELASCQDPMFTVFYPPRGTFTTSHGVEVDIPSQFYDADVFNVWGTADLGVLKSITAGSGYQPVETDDGHGLANIDVNEWKDSNLEAYNEIILDFPVNPNRVVLSSKNPYEAMAAAIDPANEMFVVKLLLDKQLPIDVGREYYTLDKEPVPQTIGVSMSLNGADLSAKDPQGRPVLAAHVPLSFTPAAQTEAWSRLGQTGGFQRSVPDMAAHGGLIRFNYVHRDIFDPSVIGEAHGAGRLFTQGASLGPFGDDAWLRVTGDSDFATKLRSFRFQPEVALVMLDGRWVLDKGFAPAVYPTAAPAQAGTAPRL